MLSLYHQNKDLIDLGAYKPGSNQALDSAGARFDLVQQLLTQGMNESMRIDQLFQRLKDIFQ